MSNIKDTFIFKNITFLKTPVGFFSVCFKNEPVGFSVKKNPMDWPIGIIDEDNNIIEALPTYCNYCIVLDSSKLQIRKEYVIKFTSFEKSKWEYLCSDQYTCCYNTTIDDWVIGIGASDPNEEKKEYQDYMHTKEGLKYYEYPPYDESDFVQYTTTALNTLDGFTLKLFDRTQAEITIEVAWIKMGVFPQIEYKKILGCWLS